MFIHSDKMIIGADIGGTHITTAIVHPATLEVEPGSIQRIAIDGKCTKSGPLLNRLLEAFNNALAALGDRGLAGISIAMPGPFDYANGIFRLRELDKFNCLFGINFKAFLISHLQLPESTPVLFNNDADCFGLGAYQLHVGSGNGSLIGITLGTGFGTSFVKDGIIVDQAPCVPTEGNLFNQELVLYPGTPEAMYFDMAEDIVSSRGLLNYINTRAKTNYQDLTLVADLAVQKPDSVYSEAFRVFGHALGACLAPWTASFQPDKLVIGGGITGSADLFMPALREALATTNTHATIEITAETEMTTLVGAAHALNQRLLQPGNPVVADHWRKTHQPLLPRQIKKTKDGEGEKPDVYEIYPFTSIAADTIHTGFEGLASRMKDQSIVAIDGYIANDWPALRDKLSESLRSIGVKPLWIEMSAFLKAEPVIESMVAPFMGADSSVWGKMTDLQLSDYYETDLFSSIISNDSFKVNSDDEGTAASELVIVFGIGAGLVGDQVPVIYVDLPRNEVQYRMRAGSAFNLGSTKVTDYGMMYKRSYFVDWPVLNSHRSSIEHKIVIVADAQWRDTINWMTYKTLCQGFDQMCQEPIRARPWFAPGAWGGDWMQSHIPQLSDAEVNYAWSFELIVPENGLVLESSGNLLEVPFEWLMAYAPEKIIGEDSQTFGSYFPIRFDFLDTYHGGNLSIQCHPAVSYIQKHFGETITQDETYYMLDCEPGAGVYLGFQEDIVPADFQRALVTSQSENKPIDIEDYVQFLPAKKHDLFLIPNQTVHSAGVNNLVLEISATPYIFTFKMYDWVRPDLNGQPRPINIEHAFNNLDFSRKGKQVQQELCSEPQILESTPGFKRIHLPTHAAHFYDIHRLELTESHLEETDGKCHILMVVEGPGVSVELVDNPDNHQVVDFAFAETFIIPASVKQYRLIIQSGSEIKIVKAFIR